MPGLDIVSLPFASCQRQTSPSMAAAALAFRDLFLQVNAFMLGQCAMEWTDAYVIIRAGHFYLLDQVAITSATMDAAATNGRLDMVRWLHEHTAIGCTTMAMDGAATYEHLNVVTFLHTHHRREGCDPWRRREWPSQRRPVSLLPYVGTIQPTGRPRRGDKNPPAAPCAMAGGATPKTAPSPRLR
ncbi:Aste57867_19259 [Aphanomyces stellatus]|uniref:Aste57867_19259 protein n=1 Tax=Aphanomyces stellatus TaxID=120398 RepID=A0A485LE34_9STRA|nr:hypothetical protein As57867_019195 [Aphanomyces stellatus]VFT95979.1 Aste57867_19259 [Aphanomyces stellatus]